MYFLKKLFLFSVMILVNINLISSQNWIQLGNTIYGTNSGDGAGSSVSISQDGTILAIGSPSNDINGTYSGKVSVYQLVNSQWVQLGADINGRSGYNHSGAAIKLSQDGKTLIIGSSTDHDTSGNWYGSIMIYRWNNISWEQLGNTIYGDVSGAYFGYSVGISSDGNEVIGVAPYDYNKVKAYRWNNNSWQQMGSSILGDKHSGLTGGAIDLSADGNSIIVGEPYSSTNGNNSGKVKIYSWNGTSWIQKGNELVGVLEDRLGHNVNINSSGNTIVIGTPLNDTNGQNTGELNVYNFVNDSWVQKGQSFFGKIATASDCCLANFASSIDDSGDTFAYWSVTKSSPSSGSVLVYIWNGIQWTQKGDSIFGGNGNNTDVNFVSLSSDGQNVAIGFPYDYSFSDGKERGRVKTYNWSLPTSNKYTYSANTKIYPNPFDDHLFINSDNIVTKINVYNVDGKLVYVSKNLIDKKIELKALGPGIYFLKIYTDKGVENKRIIKN
jgi:hypothetical protein